MTGTAPTGVTIRPSCDADVGAMVDIYAHHIQKGIGDLGGYPVEPPWLRRCDTA